MKTWNKPEMAALNISCTEQGKNVSKAFDEIRVDQNGNYWASFASGQDSNLEVNGTITVN